MEHSLFMSYDSRATKQLKDENIKPVMLEQRAKLEPKISEADKQLIAEFRVEFEKKKAKAEARFEEMKQKRENGESVDFRKMHKKGRKSTPTCTTAADAPFSFHCRPMSIPRE